MILVDDGYGQDPTGSKNNIDYYTDLISHGEAVRVAENNNIALITLTAIQSLRPDDNGTISVELSNPDSVGSLTATATS